MMTQALVFLSLVGLSYQAGLGNILGSLPGNLGDLVDFTQEFSNFMQKHGRVYKDSAEKEFRLSVFKQNFQDLLQLQKEGRGTAAFGVTKFADWTKEERAQLNGAKLVGGNLPASGNLPPFPTRSKRQVANFDWVSQGKVTPIKDQKQCGSCWAFSTAAVIESEVAIATGQFVNVSEQELVSCVTNNNGCQGGDPRYAIVYSRTTGLSPNANYPYTATNGTSCTPSNTGKTFSTDWWYVPANETQMASVIQQKGPIVFIMYVPNSMYYLNASSDVYQPTAAECQNNTGSHAVAIVGYGVSNISGLPYWLIKNSWGTGWGNNGYFKLYRGAQSCFGFNTFWAASTSASLKWNCTNSQDEAMSCKYWQSLGYCNQSSQYYSYVTGQCPAACGLCPVGSGK